MSFPELELCIEQGPICFPGGQACRKGGSGAAGGTNAVGPVHWLCTIWTLLCLICLSFSNSCRQNKCKDLFSRRYFLTYCFIKSLWTLCLRFSAVYLLFLCLCQRKLVCFGLEMMTLKWLLCTESCWDEFPDGSSQYWRGLFVRRWLFLLFLWLAANLLLFFALLPNSWASLAL